MTQSGRIGSALTEGGTESPVQLAVPYEDVNGGRYRIRTYDFHRVKMALYR